MSLRKARWICREGFRRQCFGVFNPSFGNGRAVIFCENSSEWDFGDFPVCAKEKLEKIGNRSNDVIMKAIRLFTVSDGRFVINLEPDEEGGSVVTSPLDPQLITEAESVEVAFLNAKDAFAALTTARKKLKHPVAV